MPDEPSFEHRYGGVPIPGQLRPDEVSQELQAKVWAGLHLSLREALELVDYGHPLIGDPWHGFLYRWHVRVEHRPSDEFDNSFEFAVKKVRSLVYVSDFVALYKFLETVVRTNDMDRERQFIAFALEDSRAAWRLAGDLIVPVSSAEEAESVGAAVQQVSEDGPEGAKAHLARSSSLLASGDWAGSVRESIHAVEAVARTFENAPTLGDAIKAMQRSGKVIHPALAKGFLALYGYTSDEKGIRHALLDAGSSPVSESEALFMFGACASFCQYLLNLAR